jgi:Uma2 family endonuclease
LIQKGCEDAPSVKLSYFERAIEIVMPGELHEVFAHIIGYLATTFLLEKGIPFVATRQKDQEKPGIVSLQADESYCLRGSKPIPDLSIEVVFSSGGVDKLARYQALGVPEVWFWQDGALSVYHLRAVAYERIARSELPGLADLDIGLLQRCIVMAETDCAGAVQRLKAAL